ncbi:GAF domain-containing protein [Danxiaibacter flavus]|uniref:GAF domain-containing protein n=1 Tax=Danxiaibacter flavus TaxID=3049108 RepID=A0ABV3ZJR8_9BACT|nr:GAF domain-containing protein [Chitinophagaceae bacterium DXS]
MQQILLNILTRTTTSELQHSSFSLKPFITYLKNLSKDESSVKAPIYPMLLEKFQKYPELEHPIKNEDLHKYKKLFDLVYVCLSTLMDDEKQAYWGISLPVSPLIVYGSERLYETLTDATCRAITGTVISEQEMILAQKKELLYSMILERFYNIKITKKSNLIRSFVDHQTLLTKYFKLNVDNRFVEVTTTMPLPEIDIEHLHIDLREPPTMDVLDDILPLENFHFSGMSIVTIKDITEQYAIENIKSILLNNTNEKKEVNYVNLVQSLKTLAGNSAIEFGLLPLLSVNDKLVLDYAHQQKSVVVSLGRDAGIAEQAFLSLATNYVKNPRLLFFRNHAELIKSHFFLMSTLQHTDIQSFAMLPIFYNAKMAGAMEIYSRVPDLLDESILANLEPALPLIAQLMQKIIDDFNIRINDVIKRKYTALQSAVQWKFNEAAWHYMQNRFEKKKNPLEQIVFNKVYPLYGAVDIRNSTLERNEALRSDLRYQLTNLVDLLEKIKQSATLILTDEFIFETNKWKERIKEFITTEVENNINYFRDSEVLPFLQHVQKTQPDCSAGIAEYLAHMNDKDGEAYKHRRLLEESMQTINASISQYLDLMNMELQTAFPFYFEKFRTDGVEYDIYIGQSIAPDKHFELKYLKDIRLWQLTSMAAIAQLTKALVPQIPKALFTTQLIFIHTNPLDIEFRIDEKRFDVKGGYNIQYQVIKKRIDKAFIKNTEERLTQPGKIAMVYYNQKDAEEYVQYIKYLQEQNMLLNDLEYLELQELQGVSGLKALRVGVNMK